MQDSTFYKIRTADNNEFEAARHYDAYGKLYDNDRNFSFYGHFADKLLQKLPVKTFRRIVEIGCGTGILTGKLAHSFPEAELNALDISSNMLALASSKPRLENVSFFRDLSELPFTDYDLIISNYSYHWWSDEFCRRLKAFVSENCLFALSAPAKCNDMASGNIAIARSIKALRASAATPIGKTAGVTVQNLQEDLGPLSLRTFDNVYSEEFADPEEFIRTLTVRGSILALSTAYDASEPALENEIRTNLASARYPIRINWRALVMLAKTG